MNIKPLPRKFKIGASILNDPTPNSSLQLAFETLCQEFPILRGTHIFESDGRLSACGTYLEFEAIMPPVKTQG